jgi:hypothetical protein
MPATDCSGRDDYLAEPLSGIEPLLLGGIYDPSLFAAECIRRNHTLGLELVVAYGITELYLTQRCHGLLLLSALGTSQEDRRNICAMN